MFVFDDDEGTDEGGLLNTPGRTKGSGCLTEGDTGGRGKKVVLVNDTQLFETSGHSGGGGGGFQEGEGEQLKVWLLCSRNTVRGHIRSWTFTNNTKLF